MTDEQCEVLSRFFDGEPVDEERLEEALSQPESVAWLLELAGLRRTLRADLGLPSAEFCDRMRQRLRTPAWKRFLRARLVPVAVAASLLLAAGTAGYGLRPWLEGTGRPTPQHARAAVTRPLAPPTPETPRPAPPPTVARPQPVTVRPPIPAPRSRVAFDQWRDSGGHN